MRDRGFVAETVYGCLREKRMLEYLSATDGPAGEPSHDRTSPLEHDYRASSSFDLVAPTEPPRHVARTGYSGRALEDWATAMRASWRNRCAVSTGRRSRSPCARDLPDWLAERLLTQFTETEALALVQALNQPATLDLRVNTFKAERAEVQARLIQEGVAVETRRRTRPSACGAPSARRCSVPKVSRTG